MKHNEILRQEFIGVIEKQIKDNDPKETRVSYERLVGMGYTPEEAKTMLAQCLTVEMFNVIKYQKKFDEQRYVKSLRNLPNDPF